VASAAFACSSVSRAGRRRDPPPSSRSPAPSKGPALRRTAKILGGDVAVSLLYREASPEARPTSLRQKGDWCARSTAAPMARPVSPDGPCRAGQLKAGRAGLPALRQARAAQAGRALAETSPSADGVWGRGGRGGSTRRMNVGAGRAREGGRTPTRRVRRCDPARTRSRSETPRKPGPRLLMPSPPSPNRGSIQPGSSHLGNTAFNLATGVSDRPRRGDQGRYPHAGCGVRGLAEAGGGIASARSGLTEFIA